MDLQGAVALSGYHADPESGYFLSDKHRHIAEILKDYNPDLSLVWIPNDKRTAADAGKEFAVMHRRAGKDYVVFYIDKNQLDERVLHRVIESDMSRNDILSRLQVQETVAEMMRLKQQEEISAERRDKVATILRSPLHTFRAESGRIIHK